MAHIVRYNEALAENERLRALLADLSEYLDAWSIPQDLWDRYIAFKNGQGL